MVESSRRRQRLFLLLRTLVSWRECHRSSLKLSTEKASECPKTEPKIQENFRENFGEFFCSQTSAAMDLFFRFQKKGDEVVAFLWRQNLAKILRHER
jgi:hypothetical protein